MARDDDDDARLRRVGRRVLRAPVARSRTTRRRHARIHLDRVGWVPRRLPIPRRPVVLDDDPVRHRDRCTHSPVRDRVHARRPALLTLLRVYEPVRRFDAGAGTRLELPGHIPGLGGRGPLFVPADLVLVRAQLRRGRGQEGLRHEPSRRLRLHARDVLDLREARIARLQRDERRWPTSVSGTATAIALAVVRRCNRQERAAAVAHLAPGRNGGSHPGVGPHSRRHDGDGGRVPGRARARVLRRLTARGRRRGMGRRDHGAVRGDDRRRPERHQARCWRTRRSASSGTCSSAPEWARTAPRSS